MGALEQAIQNAIRLQVDRRQIRQIISGAATNVGETTCDVVREDAPVIYGVRLNAIDDSLESFVTVYPKSGSSVIVGVIENLETEAVVLRCSEVEKVKLKIGQQTLLIDENGFVFNEGKLGALVKIESLVERINRVEDKLKSHQHAYIPYPNGTAGAPVLTTPASAAAPPNNTLVFVNTKVADIGDSKLKH
jgi:hypothetical protein